MTQAYETYNDIIHKSLDGKTLIFSNKQFDKKWIKIPKNVPGGGRKSNVIDAFNTQCRCGSHNTRIYVLQDAYITAYCTTKQMWMWVEKPSDADLDQWKSSSKSLNS